MTNLFIPAQMALLDDETLVRIIQDYHGYLFDIPAPVPVGSDPAEGLRRRLTEAITAIEEELAVRDAVREAALEAQLEAV